MNSTASTANAGPARPAQPVTAYSELSSAAIATAAAVREGRVSQILTENAKLREALRNLIMESDCNALPTGTRCCGVRCAACDARQLFNSID